MEYLVIAFRSRSHTVKFSVLLQNNGISNEIVNTPKEAGVGCGLSVKVKKESYTMVKKVLMQIRPSSFAGVFLVKLISGKRIVRTV